MSNSKNLYKENVIPRLPSHIINEYKMILEYLSQNYYIKIQLKENTDNLEKENIIVITVEKEDYIERFIFEKILKFEDFKKLGKLFKLPDNIEEVYDLILELLEEKNISIKEIILDETLTLLIKRKLLGYKEPFNVEIELLKKDRNNEDLIDALYKALDEKEEKINSLKLKNESLEKMKQNINEKINIEYFKFDINGKKYYFNDKYNRITNSLTVSIASNEQLFSFTKCYNISFKKYFYEMRIYHNDSSSSQNVSLNANSNEPTFYMKTPKSSATIYLYNNNDEIIIYYLSLFISRTHLIAAYNKFPADIFNIINYPS